MGGMRDTRLAAGGMLAAIERSGYYPGVVADAVSAALGSEPVVSYVVHHDALFDPGMEVRRPDSPRLLAHRREPGRGR